MAETELAAEDAGMQAAVAAIMKLPPESRGFDARENTIPSERENKTTPRDPIEKETSSDLAESEDAEAAAKAQAKEGDKKETKTAVAKEGDDEPDYIEIPAAEEGGEAERVPLAQAVEALKQVKEFKGGVTAAINEAQAQYIRQQDEVMAQVRDTYRQIREKADVALKAIPMPQPPRPAYGDPRSPHYDPERFLAAQKDYELQMQAVERVKSERDAAARAEAEVESAQVVQRAQREYAQLARHKGFEDFADPQKRDVAEKAILTKLDSLFGIKAEDLEGVRSHKLFLLADAAIKAREAPAKVVEVKKQVQERAAKVVRGQAQQARDPSTGKFQNQARERLAKEGTEDAMAAFLLSNKDLMGPAKT